MLRLLQILFLGHVHDWEAINEERGMWRNHGPYILYTLRCKRCGNLKRKVIDLL